MTKEELIAIVSSRYDELESLNKIKNLYDYEKSFDDIFRDLGRQVLEKNISELPGDRRKKKHSPSTDSLK